MYLRSRAEIAAASRAARALGYTTSIRDLTANDRYVSNIVLRLAGGSLSDQRELENAIDEAVTAVRQ